MATMATMMATVVAEAATRDDLEVGTSEAPRGSALGDGDGDGGSGRVREQLATQGTVAGCSN